MENCVDISVIVPAYNVENYISQCLESIMCQTFTDIEIIVIDDGSQDSTGSICDNYARRDGRIKVIHQGNAGVVNARKKGIELAKGRMIAFADGDDWLEADMLEKMRDAMLLNAVDIVAIGYIKEFEGTNALVYNGLTEKKYSVFSEYFLKNAIYIREKKRMGIEAYLWAKLFWADILKDCLEEMDEDIHFSEDLLFLWRYLVNVKEMYVLEEALYHYRQRDESCVHTYDENFYSQINEVYNRLKRLFIRNNIYERVKESLGQWMFKSILVGINGKFDFGTTFTLPEYYFENDCFAKDTKVILYGAGRVGRGYYQYIKNTKCVELVAWVDKNYCKEELRQMGVVSIEEIKFVEYDCILIATIYENMANDIKCELMNKGIEARKIIWLWPKSY